MRVRRYKDNFIARQNNLVAIGKTPSLAIKQLARLTAAVQQRNDNTGPEAA